VLCIDGTDANVALPGAGGEGTPMLSVTAGTQCAIGEDIAGFPAGWVVTYTVDGQPSSATPPVFTVEGNVTVSVTITNDPSAVAAVTTTPTIAPPPPTDGTVAPTMPGTLPPTGGKPGQPLVIAVAFLALGSVAVVYATRRRAPSSTER
jgi:hypothetical protein